jgi:hypothetical protein
MTDHFLFESPFGIAGRIFNKLILTRYLKKFLTERNQVIKYYAEQVSGKNCFDVFKPVTNSINILSKFFIKADKYEC